MNQSQRVATCSSDRTIKVFDTGATTTTSGDGFDQQQQEQQQQQQQSGVPNVERANATTLTGHEGPVWQVSWAHPKFGALLASCSFDHTVMIWKETSSNVFSRVYVTPKGFFDGSVNAISWAPHEFGCAVAACSSDGSVAVISNVSGGGWQSVKISNEAHAVGCTGVSWGQNDEIASCGCDNLCKIWTRGGAQEGGGDSSNYYNQNQQQQQQQQQQQWRLKKELRGHADWVRDVQWAPNNGGSNVQQLASCSQDGKVFIWTESNNNNNNNNKDYHSVLLNDFNAAVWRLSWSVVGNVLAVSDANNQVSVWKESVDGKWTRIQSK
jgi:protein transport protein SEC13